MDINQEPRSFDSSRNTATKNRLVSNEMSLKTLKKTPRRAKLNMRLHLYLQKECRLEFLPGERATGNIDL
jgi:hypothetical protein